MHEELVSVLRNALKLKIEVDDLDPKNEAEARVRFDLQQAVSEVIRKVGKTGVKLDAKS